VGSSGDYVALLRDYNNPTLQIEVNTRKKGCKKFHSTIKRLLISRHKAARPENNNRHGHE
jgi:hypothetical protein